MKGMARWPVRRPPDLEAHAVVVVAFVCAVLSMVGDVLPQRFLLTAVLAGVAVLVSRAADHPVRAVGIQPADRSAFDGRPWSSRLQNAREVCVFAPSAVNLLSPHRCEALRTTVLSRPDGRVRVVVLDPAATDAVQVTIRHLDEKPDRLTEVFGPALDASLRQLQRMAAWREPGACSFRLLDVNPGFSLVAIDPATRHGVVIVEFHAYRNTSAAARMHLELARADDPWYTYWTHQFEAIWSAARPSSPTQPHVPPPHHINASPGSSTG